MINIYKMHKITDENTQNEKNINYFKTNTKYELTKIII